jgi:hypothetical protein
MQWDEKMVIEAARRLAKATKVGPIQVGVFFQTAVGVVHAVEGLDRQRKEAAEPKLRLPKVGTVWTCLQAQVHMLPSPQAKALVVWEPGQPVPGNANAETVFDLVAGDEWTVLLTKHSSRKVPAENLVMFHSKNQGAIVLCQLGWFHAHTLRGVGCAVPGE